MSEDPTRHMPAAPDGVAADDAVGVTRADKPRGAVEAVESLIDRRVLIFGSLPPLGRDLDLLARPEEEEGIASGLVDAGFENKGRLWVRFVGCSADVVELVPAHAWGLPEDELANLFTQGVPIAGAVNLVRAAAHHRLLIMARKLARARGPLGARASRDLADVIAEDPDAWQKARTLAGAWKAEQSLSKLEARWKGSIDGSGRPSPPADRVHDAGRSWASSLRATVRPPRNGVVIALSGLDGCGKSSQAAYLQQALSRLGQEPVVEWTSIVNQPEAVQLVKRAANVVLGLFRSTHGLGDGPGSAGGSDGDRARALRERSASVRFGWALLVGMTHAVRQRRATLRHLRRGRVVICDRYMIDGLVHLRYAYGYRASPATRLQTLVMRRIPPPARLTYFLDVPPEIATARKQDYELADNARRATLYRELCPKYGAIRIDGTRPPEEISALIAREVWRVVG